jgi:predicted DCC family thiol-disulfide oxidoreductase YuxK
MIGTEQLLIYDGDCAFCTKCARWIERRWHSTPAPRAIPSQLIISVEPTLVIPTPSQMNESVWWIGPQGEESGSRAIARALLAATFPWPLIGLALLTPPISWFAPVVYRVVARHRHRLPGATSECDRRSR